MKTKIGMTFGLSLMLVMGVFATMLALGMFATSEVQAKVGPASDAAGFGEVKISAAVGGPGTGDIPTATVSPDEAGALARHTIIFTTPSTLVAGSDTITVQFEDDVGVPTIIDPSTVTIIATHGTNRASNITGTLVANPISVTTELVGGPPKDETDVTLLIPDMGAGEDGNQGILAGGTGFTTTVTVIFTQAAGLTNPTEGTKDYTVKVRTSAAGDTGNVTSTSYNIPRELLLNTDNGNRGKTITAVGRGFQNGTTATVWLDTDTDGAKGNDETVLGDALVGSDDTFTLTFTVNVPPFVIGTTANQIRAIDGQTNVDDGTVATYLVDGLMTVTPKEASIGDTVTVTIKDWPADEDPTLVTQFTLGGVNIFDTLALLTAATSITSGEDTFTFTVPDGVTLGKQEIKLSTASESDTQNMTILGAKLEVTPSAIAPNQTVTIQGRGYTDTGTITLGNDSDADSIMTIGGVTIPEANIDENVSVSVDSSGNWVASVVMPANSVTVEPGVYELKAFDSAGREGVTDITIIDRTITLSPPESRSGTVLTVNGAGYPAVNTTSPDDFSITVQYSGTGITNRTVTTTADSSGNFSTQINVPLGAGIPSTNTVTVSFTYTSGGTTFTVTDTLTHRVPGASIVIDPVSGPAGTVVTVTGTGFRGTRQVSDLTIATVDVRQVPVPSTDVDGNFTAEFIVPQIDTGAHSVKAEVGGTNGTTASASFTLLAAAVAPTAAPASAEADSAAVFAPIIDNDDNLVRVFRFDNATQGWTFYDPRPAFESANDLTTATGGDIVWIRVNEAQDFSGISLVGGWNLIVLP